jgi:hypothetical protein
VVKNTVIKMDLRRRNPAKTHWLAKMSGNWSLTLPLPVTTVPSTGSPIPLANLSCTTYVARLDFTGYVFSPFFSADLAWML